VRWKFVCRKSLITQQQQEEEEEEEKARAVTEDS
jgi:hypothetical protein